MFLQTHTISSGIKNNVTFPVCHLNSARLFFWMAGYFMYYCTETLLLLLFHMQREKEGHDYATKSRQIFPPKHQGNSLHESKKKLYDFQENTHCRS